MSNRSVKNPYYSPEERGLTTLFDVDKGESYEFDMFVVWKDKAGNLYYAQDSGCSCPTPFEGYEDAGVELPRLTKEGLAAFEQEAHSYLSTPEIQEIRSLLK